MKKVLVTGANGMLGGTLCRMLKEAGYEVVETTAETLNLTDPESIIANFVKHRPDIVVNSAAYTNVEKAEDDEKDLCYAVNIDGAGLMAKLSFETQALFIQISSDYVFGDSNPAGHTEDDEPGDTQLNVYARSKRLGELAVIENNPNSYILRPQWTFGAGGKNFIDTMLMLAETRSELNVVDDETGVPCYSVDISRHIIYVIEHSDELKPGYYHSVNEGSTNRFEQAKAIFEIAGKKMTVNPTKLADFPRKAKIANYSILLNTKLPKVQDWRSATEAYISSKSV